MFGLEVSTSFDFFIFLVLIIKKYVRLFFLLFSVYLRKFVTGVHGAHWGAPSGPRKSKKWGEKKRQALSLEWAERSEKSIICAFGDDF